MIAIIQSAQGVTSSSVVSNAATFGTTPKLGNLVIVTVSGLGATLTCADNQGTHNTWTQIGSSVTCNKNGLSTQGFLAYFYTIITSASGSFIITGGTNT